jgi:hypothetical protein
VSSTNRDTTSEALGLLAKAGSASVIDAALEALPEGDERVRDAIVARYGQLAANPKKLDPGGALRTALLRGLRSCARLDDRALLEAAARTYEFGFGGKEAELAANLRSAALVGLAGLDPRLAGFHAARLLADVHTAAGTREPALTAARVLAMQGDQLVLYLHLREGAAAGEEAAECFRALSDAPGGLLLELSEPWLERNDGVALLGLFDAVLPHPEAERFVKVLMKFVEESPHLDVIAYLATAVVAGHHGPFLEGLALRRGLPGQRGEVIREALSIS